MADATETAVVRVLLADDELDMQVLLRSVLSMDDRISIAGVASDGGEALQLFDQLHPDVLVLDERMPILYGLEVAERVLADHPNQRIIICSAWVDDVLRQRAAALGVHAVLPKQQHSELAGEILRPTR